MPKIARTSAKNLMVLVALDDMCPPKLLEEAATFGSDLLIPNIRAMMAGGWSYFTNCHATVPICKASRTSMFASWSPFRTEVFNNEADDADRYDYTQSWPAIFKRKGQVDAYGKLTHEPVPQNAIIEAMYTRDHPISKNSGLALEITDQSGISGSAHQVFKNVRLSPRTTTRDNADTAYCTVTLNGAGDAIASVAFTEKRATDPATFAVDPAPRFELGASGSNYEVGDTLEIGGLGYNPATDTYSMPDARLTVTVTELTSFFYFEDEGEHQYGVFTKAGEVVKGDALIASSAAAIFARLASEDDLSRRLLMFGLKGPHTPLVPDQDYLDMHPVEDITIPTGYDLASSYIARFYAEYAATDLYDDDALIPFIQHYLAAIEEMDADLGTIIDANVDAGLWSRTNWCVWSDHSFQLGNQNTVDLPEGIYKKFQPLSTATSCFLAIRDPSIAAGTIDEPVSALDIGPTMLRMAGIAVPDHFEGQSLLPAMRRPTRWRNSRAALSFCFGNTRSTKSVSTPAGRKPCGLMTMLNGEERLFRDDIDPLNKTDLSGLAGYATALAESQDARDTEFARLGWSTVGTGGDDIFLPSGAAETMTGGEGDDSYIIRNPATVVVENTGEGNDRVIFQPDDVDVGTFTVPDNVEFVQIEPTTNPVNITLGAGGQTVIGRFSTVTGGIGNDSIIASDASGAVTVDAAQGDDFVQGAPGEDDSITGGSGNDTLKGRTGDDSIFGGGGDNSIGGGGGNDSLTASTGNDTIFGGSDADIIYGSGGIDLLQGDTGADLIYAGAGNDLVYGGKNADTLYGEGGDDVLKPGSGADSVYGGTGANIFEIGFISGNHSIKDWSTGTGNKVRFIPGLGFGAAGAAGADILTVFLANSTDVGADCQLTIPETGAVITFTGKLKASFTAADFEVANFVEVDSGDDDDSGGND